MVHYGDKELVELIKDVAIHGVSHTVKKWWLSAPDGLSSHDEVFFC